ncbi:MAG: hypothetical protein GY739_19525, partial [Mesoflavibacter sp.]|nr:hypothetical protein [Mesoflavibacter sp.]
ELEHTQQDCVKLYEKNQALESKLEEARYSATDYAMKLGRANEKLEEAREAMCIYVREHVDNEEIETDEQAVIYFKNTFNEKNYN